MRMKRKPKVVDSLTLKLYCEGTVMVFPMALRKTFEGQDVVWEEFIKAAGISSSKELYFGGLESVGFGRTNVTLKLIEK